MILRASPADRREWAFDIATHGRALPQMDVADKSGSPSSVCALKSGSLWALRSALSFSNYGARRAQARSTPSPAATYLRKSLVAL